MSPSIAHLSCTRDHLKLTSLVAECIYNKQWLSASSSATTSATKALRPQSGSSIASAGEPDNGPGQPRPARLSAEDDAKLIFGTVFSLRNMIRKLGGPDDQ